MSVTDIHTYGQKDHQKWGLDLLFAVRKVPPIPGMSCHSPGTGRGPWSEGCPPCSASPSVLSQAWRPGSPAGRPGAGSCPGRCPGNNPRYTTELGGFADGQSVSQGIQGPGHVIVSLSQRKSHRGCPKSGSIFGNLLLGELGILVLLCFDF